MIYDRGSWKNTKSHNILIIANCNTSELNTFWVWNLNLLNIWSSGVASVQSDWYQTNHKIRSHQAKMHIFGQSHFSFESPPCLKIHGSRQLWKLKPTSTSRKHWTSKKNSYLRKYWKYNSASNQLDSLDTSKLKIKKRLVPNCWCKSTKRAASVRQPS